MQERLLSFRKFQLKVVGIALLVFRAYPVQSVKFVPLVEERLALSQFARQHLASRYTHRLSPTPRIPKGSQSRFLHTMGRVFCNVPIPDSLTRGWA